MHPTLHRRAFSQPGWIFEHKLDGFRGFARKSGDRVELLSRQGRSMAAAFPEIMRALSALPADAVLDAELVVPDDGTRPPFEPLRQRAFMSRPRVIAAAASECPAVLCVFDCLFLEGEDRRELPLVERKAVIEALIDGIPGLQVVPHMLTSGETVFAAATELGLEGMVAKQAGSAYRAGRQPAWLNIKNAAYYRQEARAFGR